MVWFAFIISIVFGLEIAMKSYAFGVRRAYASANWTIKIEFYY